MGSRTKLEILHGDFFERVHELKKHSVDLIFADPPYFLSNGGMSVASGKQALVDKGDWDKANSNMSPKEFQAAWIESVARVLHPDGSVVISGTYHSIFQCADALEKNGFKMLNDIIWFKPNGAPNLSRRRVTASHETLLWAAKSANSKFVYNYDELRAASFEGDNIKRAGSQLRSVWWIPNTPASEKTFGKHPTQKPLKLLTRVVMAFSKPGQVVLDPFMGSGTTGVACKYLGRKFIGIEQSHEYVELAKRRMGIN